MYHREDTIAAIATPPGEGGVAIIRISGPQAVDVGSRIFSGPLQNYRSHTAHYGHIIDGSGQVVDQVIILPFLDGRSYTGENSVEIHCHGGSLISRRVLAAVLSAGARLALPGEFTYRAFMNGKLDLAQAEAVQALIGAKNELMLDIAGDQLQGRLSERIGHFQQLLIDIAAMLEAWVDFPEEGIEFSSNEQVALQLEQVTQEMEKLLSTFHEGRILHEGVTVCLAGSPNVGKSSLMNALLDRERAIVTPIAGTTRDILEDHFRLNGLNVRLMDTAGIRDTQEEIEREGIRRTRKAIEKADLILWVLDVSRKFTPQDQTLLQELPPQKTVVIWNKVDLPHDSLPPLPIEHVTKVSAKHNLGLDQLRVCIDKVIWQRGMPGRDEVMITNLRHKEALQKAIEACKKVLQGFLEGLSPEFLCVDMRICLQELGKIIGSDITEDILNAIFSKFCIGK